MPKLELKFWDIAKNQAGDVELRIDGEIVDDDTAWLYEWFGIQATAPNAFREALAQYKGQDIVVWIDSWGGNVFAAAGIYNALKEHGGKVLVKVDGKAVSAASIVAMAGDQVYMSPVSVMMVHNPWTLVQGEAKDLRYGADVLDEIKETIINAYELRTGKNRSEISALMDEATYMSAQTAIDLGFADGMLYAEPDAPAVKNSYKLSALAIQNSATASMQRFFEVAKERENKAPPGRGQSNSNSSPAQKSRVFHSKAKVRLANMETPDGCRCVECASCSECTLAGMCPSCGASGCNCCQCMCLCATCPNYVAPGQEAEEGTMDSLKKRVSVREKQRRRTR